MRLMEIDEEWQTGRRYMKMLQEDKDFNQNDALLREIKQLKERVKARKGLVAI